MLERVGLAPETIEACYVSHPGKEEEAVQAGLTKWAEGHHGYSPTWRVLLDAMVYAGVGQQHCQGLREELCQMLISVCVCVRACVRACVRVCGESQHNGAIGCPLPVACSVTVSCTW